MVYNLNDGMVWGLIPVFLAARGVTLDRIGVVTATYPLVWGMGQLATGALSDRWGRKWMIASGMWVQAVGITAFVVGRSFSSWMAGATLLGIGTALVYPTLLAAVSDVAHPDWRASAVGVYRLWRDSGYAIGALAAGLLADGFTMPFAITAIAALTFVVGSGRGRSHVRDPARVSSLSPQLRTWNRFGDVTRFQKSTKPLDAVTPSKRPGCAFVILQLIVRVPALPSSYSTRRIASPAVLPGMLGTDASARSHRTSPVTL